MRQSAARILGFDGLRALAFVLVFISHKITFATTERYGTAGVWLFFVLSGFLITRILANSRADIELGVTTFRAALQDFYLRRTLRIFPVYYLFLIAVMAMGAMGLLDLGGRLRQLCDWLFLSNVYIELHNDWGPVGHLWSLAVEEQFYLLFAPLALLLPLKRLPMICGGLILISVAAHLILLRLGASVTQFDANSFVNFGLLGLGGLAGLAAGRPLPKILRSDVAIGLALLGFLALPALMSKEEWLHAGRLGGVFVALVLIQIYQAQEGRFVAMLNSAPARRLGVISYGAYLFHPVIHSGKALNGLGYSGPAVDATGVMLDFVITVALAALSWRYLETPIRNLRLRNRRLAGEPVPLS